MARIERNSHVDHTLSVQQDVETVVPEGGYGWVILMIAGVYQILISSLPIAYGMFLILLTLETHMGTKITLWENEMIWAPLMYFSSKTALDPVIKYLNTGNKWPRITALSGVCLFCSGILFLWIANMRDHSLNVALFIIAGIFSGFGGSIAIGQCDAVLQQYFKLKFNLVSDAVVYTSHVGFIIIPVILGIRFSESALYHTILMYQFLILGLCGGLSVLLKSPITESKVLRPSTSRIEDEDEDEIYAHNATELRETYASSVQRSSQNEENSYYEPVPGTSNDIEQIATERRKNWETFPETGDNTSEGKRNWETFEDEEKIDHSDYPHEIKDTINVPKELFTEMNVNNNTTYSFENVEDLTPRYDSNIFVTSDNETVGKRWSFFRDPSYYKTLYHMIVMHYSKFLFLTLYPSILYFEIPALHPVTISYIVGYSFIVAVGVHFVLNFCKLNHKNGFYIFVTSWVCTSGFFLLSESLSEFWKIIGALLTISSLTCMELLSKLLLTGMTYKANPKYENSHFNKSISIICGLSLAIFIVEDLRYRIYYRIIGILQFVNGTIWFINYLFKRFTK